MQIRPLQQDDLPSFRILRLEALQLSPAAFFSSYEEEVKFSDSQWQERLNTPDHKEKVTLGALMDDKLCGILTLVRETRLKGRHKGYLFGFYVTPEVRGHGVGSALMKDVLQRAKECTGLKVLQIVVVHRENEKNPALKLYEKFGFVSHGIIPNDLIVDGEFVSAEHLSLTL
jgi:ribosomal protein S18 acetylase RimI-like enzyme